MLSLYRVSHKLPTRTKIKGYASLAATVSPHDAYVLLHTNRSPRTFPHHFTSAVQLGIQQHYLRANPGSKIFVNFAYTHPCTGGETSTRTLGDPVQMSHPSKDVGREEKYSATVFGARRWRRLHLASVSASDAEDVANVIAKYVSSESYSDREEVVDCEDSGVQLYVCTHGERDCRCGEWGAEVADELSAELNRRQCNDPGGGWRRYSIGEVGHVGGHKHAANLLVFPHGDWFGGLRKEHVSSVLDAVAARPYTATHWDAPPYLPEFWRGKMGLSKEEQLETLQPRPPWQLSKIIDQFAATQYTDTSVLRCRSSYLTMIPVIPAHTYPTS